MATYQFGDGGPGFPSRHIGPNRDEQTAMLKGVHQGAFKTVDDLIAKAVPKGIRLQSDLGLPEKLSEHEALLKLRGLARQNKVFRSYIGQGYYDTVVPGVIQRNILENPGWYTQYTPYQSEISQGRLEALINFQTMICDLTGLELANASLLDEATAAAEAMALAFAHKPKEVGQIFFVDHNCFAQTIGVVQTRAEPLGIEVVVGDPAKLDAEQPPFGVLLQYPARNGAIVDYGKLIQTVKARGAVVIMAADLMSLALLKTPGEMGADIAVGNTQRFGVPMGYGGPHAAYFATRDEYKRKIPGRIIGYSQDARGKPALRMALQTREQHIRRDKATSNICTSQVLLAIMASMYAVYHGPGGIRQIATVIHEKAKVLARGLKSLGLQVTEIPFFDTVNVTAAADTVEEIRARMLKAGINLHYPSETSFSIAVDEATTDDHLESLLGIFATHFGESFDLASLAAAKTFDLPSSALRRSKFLTHKVFNSHHSETKMLRYIRKLESKDLSLTRSMIPLGSCTMKLNATAELFPITWPEFANLHPFAPKNQAMGYSGLTEQLEDLLAKCTGFDAISLQPNSGAQGEYAGLLVIRKYHQVRGDDHRTVCLIPKSAHGTNPASAVMAGMTVVVVDCDDNGNIDLTDLQAKAEKHKERLAALMVTYPSTHGVFEEEISAICEVVHRNGGQVYMDGANLNAQIGLCKPGEYGPDVCHLNLHKTFCIPHGGGGPGMGPIGVKKHLAPFLPSHPVVITGGEQGIGPVSAAPWGSAAILPISLMYIWMMGEQGLTEASKVAILNANYIADRLEPHFPVLYRGVNALVAHECIVDVRPLKAKTGIEVDDIAKRLMDYGFHAPTVSFPVPGTLMIEPTESEAKDEIDRFCDAMIAIRHEIAEVETGKADRNNNVLKNAPHTADVLAQDVWDRPYSREKAVFPDRWTRDYKFWPTVGRVDNAYGDRNLMCACLPIEEYE